MTGGEKPEGYVFGRPTKYKPEFCEMLIEHMSKGLSYESFAAIAGVCRETLYRWEKDNEDFRNSKKRAMELSLLWWEKTGMAGLWGSKEAMFNSAVWIFSMKNRFRWSDKVEVSGGDETTKPITLAYKL